jgi:hypothetical protein
MAVEDDGGLLYDIADEVSINADRFRLAQDASSRRLYLTGIEFALGVAATIALRFVRGYWRGLEEGLEQRGVAPGRVGERLGRLTSASLADRLLALEHRVGRLLLQRPDEVRLAIPDLAAQIEDLLHAGSACGGALAAEAQVSGRHAVVEMLVDNGFDREQAEKVAERVSALLAGATGDAARAG